MNTRLYGSIVIGILVFSAGFLWWNNSFFGKTRSFFSGLDSPLNSGFLTAPGIVNGDRNITSSPTPTTTKLVMVKKSTSTTDIAPLSYVEALATYRKSGYYFQFVHCSGNPGSMVIKRGNNVMLDNRDTVKHTFKVGPKSYVLPGYGFVIAKAETVGTNRILCDGGGSASLTVAP